MYVIVGLAACYHVIMLSLEEFSLYMYIHPKSDFVIKKNGRATPHQPWHGMAWPNPNDNSAIRGTSVYPQSQWCNGAMVEWCYG